MNWLTKAAQSLGLMRHPGAMPFMMGLLKRTRFDYRREVGDCLDASVVTAPCLWVGRALPEAQLCVHRKMKDGSTDELPEHPMLALIQRPNAFYGDIALWMVTVLCFLIFGNAYWLIVRNGAGRPAELWWVPNWMIEPKWPQDGSAFISHYRYAPGGGTPPTEIPPEDVVHFRHGIDPRNIRMGLSPIDGVIREIFVDLESSNFVASLLRNMGVPGVVISPKGGAMPAPEDVEATKTWFKQAFGGDNRGGPLVMGAPTDVTPYGFDPKQLDLSQGRDVAEERVCACIGVPAAVVGFGAGLQNTKVGATMEELRKLAWNNGVLPYARMLADELQRSLLGEFGPAEGLKTGWDTGEVIALQEDEDKKSDRALKQFQAGLISFFEGRRRIGEEDEQGEDFYLRPIASIQVPVGAIAPAMVLPAPEPGKQAKDGRRASAAALARGEAYALLLQRQADGLQAVFEKRLSAFFGKLGAAARAAAEPLLTEPKRGKSTKDAKADDGLIARVLELLGIDAWQAELTQAYGAHYLEVGTAVSDAAALAGLGTSLPDPVARAIVAAGGSRAGLVDLDAQTRTALFEALAEGRAEGEGVAALADRIEHLVDGGPWNSPEVRARIIARTETKFAQNISTIQRAMAAGVTTFIVFDGRLGPGRSVASHIARNGSIVDAEEAVTMAEEEHPNGTLSFAPNFGDDT